MALLDALVGDPELEALFGDDAQLAAMLRVETALAAAEVEAGLITPEAAARIADACADYKPDWEALARGMAQDGVVVPALVRQLRRAVGDQHGDAVHKGVTSQDIIDTGLILRLGSAFDILCARLGSVLAVLSRLAAAEGDVPLMAHTRMQAALPFTAADKIETWRAPLDRCRLRMADLRPRLLRIQLGGPVGTRAELGPQAAAISAGVARRLALADAAPWHAQRDTLAEFAAWLSLLSGLLGKIGTDVGLLAQSEVGAVTLASAGGSSAMAHKHNPVAAETLVALARFAAGLLGIMHQALVHENERSGAAWTLEWMVLPRMVVASGASLRVGLALLEGLRFIRSGSL